MTQEDKELLLKDVCGRLPYGVKIHSTEYSGVWNIFSINPNGEVFVTDYINSPFPSYYETCKPYLFPMSSMTEEQKNEFDTRTFEIMFGEVVCNKNDEMGYGKLMAFDLDFYNKHHLDWRGLIPKGLAIDATGLNIY